MINLVLLLFSTRADILTCPPCQTLSDTVHSSDGGWIYYLIMYQIRAQSGSCGSDQSQSIWSGDTDYYYHGQSQWWQQPWQTLITVNDDPYQEQWQRSLNLDIISISSDSIIGWYTDSWLRSRQTASSQTIRFYYLPGLFEEPEIHWAGVIGARKTIKLLLADVILGSEQWNRTQTKKYLVPGGWFWWSDIISVLMRVTTW